jgi:hypothetical protein
MQNLYIIVEIIIFYNIPGPLLLSTFNGACLTWSLINASLAASRPELIQNKKIVFLFE